MFESTDQLGNKLKFKTHPKRIVSLVPSQTELLQYLGLENEVIGITKFCVHPHEWLKNKSKIGGTKNVHISTLKALTPDLIIANKEENIKDQINLLQAIAPVWVSDVNNLNDALQMIEALGVLTNTSAKANNLVEEINNSFKKLQTPNVKLLSAYLIWREPYMTVGGDTFINNMLGYCGFKNVFEDASRYPEITLQQLALTNCQIILLSSEPYPFKQKHIDEIQAIVPHTKIILVNGEFFSWYGSRLLQAANYFKALSTSTISALL
ncbi:MAG: ABC transporter substrate-binding protein [Deinococcales bacterium]|nr:ABC transporter substrate-binding protein [Chitinophagaceae bacterium]